jgi:ABC-type uncharacterized transport system ATPase subunit
VEGREDHNVYMSVRKKDQLQADFLIDVVPRRMSDGKINGAVLVMQEVARNVICLQPEEEKLLENMYVKDGIDFLAFFLRKILSARKG